MFLSKFRNYWYAIYINPYTLTFQSTQLNGKIFDNQNVAVMIWDQAKKRQIEEILKAGGAKLKYFIAKDLCNLSVAESEALVCNYYHLLSNTEVPNLGYRAHQKEYAFL